jgi:hypothetical protein
VLGRSGGHPASCEESRLLSDIERALAARKRAYLARRGLHLPTAERSIYRRCLATRAKWVWSHVYQPSTASPRASSSTVPIAS